MAELTRALAERHGDELALADETHQLTWTELNNHVNRCIASFDSLGLGEGDTVSIVAGNRIEWFVVSLACAHSGVTFVPVNWHLVAPELAYIFGDSESSVVFAGHRFVDVVRAALARPESAAVRHAVAFDADGSDPAGFETFGELLADKPADEPQWETMGGPMFYTSGTTGNPKGVRRSRYSGQESPAGWLKVAESFTRLLPPEGRTLLCGPVYHSAQWAFSWLPLLLGSSVVMRHKYDSAEVLALIDHDGVTNVHLVPTQMRRLLDLPPEVRSSFGGETLQAVLHGAAPCPPAVKREMINWWGPILTEYYGSTEGSVLSLISSSEWLERGGSVGRPVSGATITILDEGRTCGVGEIGTIYFTSARGGSFRYHNAPGKTAEAHRGDGLATTGDVGYLDEDGYLWLSDRKIDMIISGGVNIYPAEVEGVLGGHPDVLDVAVIGVPNEEFGEEVKAVVVLSPTTDGADSLIPFCREHLAGYKVPRTIDVVDALPRTGTGKVQKRKLRAPYWADLEREI